MYSLRGEILSFILETPEKSKNIVFPTDKQLNCLIWYIVDRACFPWITNKRRVSCIIKPERTFKMFFVFYLPVWNLMFQSIFSVAYYNNIFFVSNRWHTSSLSNFNNGSIEYNTNGYIIRCALEQNIYNTKCGVGNPIIRSLF